MQKNAIKILITGGTIDDIEYSDEKDAPKDHPSLIPSLLKQARVTTNIQFEILMHKDSKFVTETDRELILQKCRETSKESIIITHGTVTMIDTAQFLLKANLQKTIVLLGASIPANRKNSDALFNLGSAITAAQLLDRGVYITMNGKVLPANHAKKNPIKDCFEEA